MKTILRVCTYPTKEIPTMGLNSYMISGMETVKTIFLAPFYTYNTLPLKKNTTLILKPFLIEPSPEKYYSKIVHEIRRVVHIFRFSYEGIKLIHKNNIKIIHIHSPMYLLIAVYGKIKGLPCFISYHGNEHNKIYPKKIMGLLFNNIFNITFSLSTDINNYKKLYKNYNNRFQTINNAVDKTVFFNNRIKRKEQIITVGRLEQQKGYQYLIEGFSAFQKNNPEYQLVFVGDGQLKNILHEKVKKLGLDDNVNFVGRLNQKQLMEKYNESEIFIMSSLWEGFPKVLLEAIACGCKVVATKVDAIPSILGENYHYLISPNSSNEIETTLKKIINIKQNNYDKLYSSILTKYSWQNVRSDMERMYGCFI